jgi:tetrapyrrole methylase family protein/MazG family protein
MTDPIQNAERQPPPPPASPSLAMSPAPPTPPPPASTPTPAEFDLAGVQAIRDPFARLRVIMKRLLDPGGCPWDREQDHATLRQYMIEEAYEAAEAIDDRDDAALREELGDVALQVVFHAELAERRGAFNVEDVMDSICEKLIRRHPHVFGEVEVDGSGDVLRNWEQIKKEEKKRKAEAAGKDKRKVSVLSGVPRALPGLQRATRLQEKASRVGFDWDRAEGSAQKVREEVEEFLEQALKNGGGQSDARNGGQPDEAMTEEFGDLLFALVNLSRFLGVRAEEAMEGACDKFIRRFTAIEQAAHAQGRDLKAMTLAEMDALWDEAKRQEKERA